MCGMTERSGWSRTTPRPRWGRLYALGGLMLAALAVVEVLVSAGPGLTALRCGLVLGGVGAVGSGGRPHPAAPHTPDRGGLGRRRGAPRGVPSPPRGAARCPWGSK